MTTIGVRVNVPANLYNIMVQEQDKQRSLKGKKPALDTIILEYFIKGIRAENTSYQANPIGNTATRKNDEVLIIGRPVPNVEELKEWEQSLREQQNDYNEQVLDLIEKNKIIIEKIEDAVQIKQESLEILEKAQQKTNEIEIQKEINAILNKDINEKIEQISDLKKEIDFMREDVKTLLKSIDHNTRKNVFWDMVVPFLPVLVTILCTVFLGRRISTRKRMRVLEKQILDIFNNIKPDLKKDFIDFIKKHAKNYGKETDTKDSEPDSNTT